MFTYQDRTITLLESDITLDAPRRCKIGVVSHGHADHIRAHHHVIATPPTAAFVRSRLGNMKITELAFGQEIEIEGYRISLHAAGHILGSAQILVQRDGVRLLYSGDFNTEMSAAAEPLEYVGCEVLIMECTFGHPHYHFPKRAELYDHLCEWAAAALRDECVPVVIAYSLGKSQQAMKVLADNGFNLCVHGSVQKLTSIYQRFGYAFGEVAQLRAATPIAGRVVVAPPQAHNTKLLQRLTNKRTIYLSGWGVRDNVRHKFGVDEVLPLSDHADFEGLLEYVRRVNPKKIYTTHGPVQFAEHLRKLGYKAEALDEFQGFDIGSTSSWQHNFTFPAT